MQRKQFLITTISALPLLAFPQSRSKRAEGGNKKPFKINAGKSRFNEETKFRGKHPNDTKISAADTEGQLSVFEFVGYEKTGPSLHLHFAQDEIFFVVEGEYKFVVGEETFNTKVGDTIFLPRNIPHTWIQLTDKGKLIYLVQPAGQMEEFFRKMNALTTKPTEDEIQKIHLEHGMKVVGPPLTI